MGICVGLMSHPQMEAASHHQLPVCLLHLHARLNHPPFQPAARPVQQSLNQLQGQTKPLRRAVEARFDEIKAVTESPDPVFDAEMSEWWVPGALLGRRGKGGGAPLYLCRAQGNN
jgi:hypothetical protein